MILSTTGMSAPGGRDFGVCGSWPYPQHPGRGLAPPKGWCSGEWVNEHRVERMNASITRKSTLHTRLSQDTWTQGGQPTSPAGQGATRDMPCLAFSARPL